MHNRNESFALLVGKASISLALIGAQVVSNGVILIQHLLIALLGVLCGELATVLGVINDGVDIYEIASRDRAIEYT